MSVPCESLAGTHCAGAGAVRIETGKDRAVRGRCGARHAKKNAFRIEPVEWMKAGGSAVGEKIMADRASRVKLRGGPLTDHGLPFRIS